MAFFLSDALKKAAGTTRGFLSASEIKQEIRKSQNFERDGTDPVNASALLIFSTSKQQTWLVATPKRLYCILDDVRKPEPHINWSLDKKLLLDPNGKLKIRLRSKEYTDRSGLVDIGDKHQDWIFTRSLFPSGNIEQRIEELIRAQMGG